MQAKTVRIGTRGSPLALAQAREVEARLAAAHAPGAYAFDIRVIRTSGDRIQDRPLSEAGGSKGFFTKEIEEALLAGEIDIAVHSMKDMPTLLPPGLAITCYLPRQDVRDAFIGRGVATLTDLPAGAVVATSSLRRQAQVRRLRPDLQVQSLRGNVETRLNKLAEGVARGNHSRHRRPQSSRPTGSGEFAAVCRRDAAGRGSRRRRDRNPGRRFRDDAIDCTHQSPTNRSGGRR